MAGLGRRVFTPGEVLTATNVMGYLQDQAVMNFAGTAARGSAIGTAVSEGMVSYLADSNVVQAYDGSAWNSLAYSSAVPASTTIGLKTVVPTSVSAVGGSGSYDSNTGLITFGAGTTSLTINGVFTSAYKNYRLVFNCTKSAAAGNDAVQWRLTASGTPTSSGYYQAAIAFAMSNAASQNLGGSGATALYMTRIYQASIKATMSMDIYSPQEAAHTEHAGIGYGTTLGDDQSIFCAGRLPNTTQYDGVYIFATGNSISGTVQIYGYED